LLTLSLFTQKGTPVTNSIDYSSRDKDARLTFYVLLWKRRGITLEHFDDYWRDVHGPVCARLPGQFQYWQYHVAHNEGGLFPAVEGVDGRTADDDQFDGIAELTFRSTADRQAWMNASTILMADEHNLFRKAIGYVTAPDNSRTLIDGIQLGEPNGGLDVVKFHVLVRKADQVGLGDFHQYLTEKFAPAAAGCPHVLKFRLHLFEPLDTGRPEAAGVVHDEPPEKQYHGAFEIGFRNALEREAFFASKAYATVAGGLSRFVQKLAPFPERNAYTFVYNGRMTVAGQRGSRPAEVIASLGALNQLKDDILDLVLGKGVR
jgi:hypothetical protein